MNSIISDEQQIKLLKIIRQMGVFVTSGEKDNSNVMANHWCTIGTFWNKPVFVLPVRHSKYTHSLLESIPYFGVSVPIKDMRNELINCDHLSGHEINKFEKLNLHPKLAKHIPTYLIAECGMYLECKTIFTAEMDTNHFNDEELKQSHYANGDYHTMYYAEILDCYDDEY